MAVGISSLDRGDKFADKTVGLRDAFDSESNIYATANRGPTEVHVTDHRRKGDTRG